LHNDSADPGVGFDNASVLLCDPGVPELAPNCGSTIVIVSGVGSYSIDSSGVMTFTPEPTFIGTPEGLAYIVKDSLHMALATSIYTPTVMGVTAPVASPDTTSGPLNEAQSAVIMGNDRAGAGGSLDTGYLKLWDPVRRAWVTTPVSTADGTYRIVEVDCATVRTVSMAATPVGLSRALAVIEPLICTLLTIEFTPAHNFVGTATAIRYQIRDVNHVVAESTYTPTIDTGAVATLAMTGPGQLGGIIQLAGLILLLGVGMLVVSRRRTKS
jgi:CshA-type fibril repeat protein